MKSKFIFVVGGVMSGVGKGIATASTARILKDYGYNVTAIKIDPYLNVDAGTMNPTEHGEVYVTKDGLESDQDLGNYERFIDQDITRENYMTTGMVYNAVIQRERSLGYAGKCVEVVPHITNEIEQRIKKVAQKRKADFVLIEIGGTAGEYQNLVYLEAARIMRLKWPKQVCFMLVSYFPIPSKVGEMKTKPTQHAVRELNSVGIQPDLIIARAAVPLDDVRKKKVSTFCNVSARDIISAPDIESIYQVPVNFERDHLGQRIFEIFGLKPRKQDGKEWRKMASLFKRTTKEIKIGIVGKYFGTGDFILSDSYISVIEALKHGALANRCKAKIDWINAEEFENKPSTINKLKDYHGILIPGGFGSRGVKGKLRAVKFVRENDIPYLGLCYGLQMAVIEFARNVCDLKSANTTEIEPKTKYPVIHTMTDQIKKIAEKNMGGSMRLGAYTCRLKNDSISKKLYNKNIIHERHRHRYEVNPKYVELFIKKGLSIAGINPASDLVEIIEIPKNKFFVAVQFHPEFQSRPLLPHPLFVGFIKAAVDKSQIKKQPRQNLTKPLLSKSYKRKRFAHTS